MTLPPLSIFVPTFFLVSLTPGMCMTLSLTLGMTIGVRRTFWMMYGELIGVGLVAGASVIGAAAIMLNYPAIFILLKIIGGLYLGWLGLQLWLSRGKLALDLDGEPGIEDSPRQLALQGFVTAVANPKGWAFFIALLPPFIDQQRPLVPQLVLLLGIILTIEFMSLVLYASGGRTLGRNLLKSGNVRCVNRVAGTLMAGVGFWLALG
ncbi:threonine transporter RhtB [Geothermobacter hydrogeniphilus]|uniref:Threonine transporter RhtB n=1 Tax=Geothermobacter hydrogeniphilus TaxID=1969733 RepID=A0A2K2H9C7_9BACT|nr:LysE family translocator [Geothermobacter hydrogeniphilus]PNU19914.1 threonine transporter RhtB [Geothermobacter hydrogeniphilus]